MSRASQIFHPFTNTLARASVVLFLLLGAGAAWTYGAFLRSPYSTGVGVARPQEVPFSHEHHAGRLGLDCRFCHTSVERAAVAGIPAVQTCMLCHAQLWTNAALLEPVRAAFASGTPMRWTRTHALPDFVYFDHHVHVNNGVTCAECHGAVEKMPLTWRSATLYMEWCIDCHRKKSTEAIVPGSPHTRQLENCSTCHR